MEDIIFSEKMCLNEGENKKKLLHFMRKLIYFSLAPMLIESIIVTLHHCHLSNSFKMKNPDFSLS